MKKCPGWTPTSCGPIHKGQPGDWWMHRCNPLAVPKNDTATILSCKPQALNGTFQCYFGQVRLSPSMCVDIKLTSVLGSWYGSSTPPSLPLHLHFTHTLGKRRKGIHYDANIDVDLTEVYSLEGGLRRVHQVRLPSSPTERESGQGAGRLEQVRWWS